MFEENRYDVRTAEMRELLGWAMEEVAEWEDHEADMIECPFGDGYPSDSGIEQMAE